MKKLMFAVLAIAAITLTGCSKDDEPTSIAGTTWFEVDSERNGRYTFTSDTYCTYNMDSTPNSDGVEAVFQYELNYPNITLYCISTNLYIGLTNILLANQRGTIKGDEMTLYNDSTGDYLGVMKKR